jgi:hypothetical protein
MLKLTKPLPDLVFNGEYIITPMSFNKAGDICRPRPSSDSTFWVKVQLFKETVLPF